jgi:hypothetical protein
LKSQYLYGCTHLNLDSEGRWLGFAVSVVFML